MNLNWKCLDFNTLLLLMCQMMADNRKEHKEYSIIARKHV